MNGITPHRIHGLGLHQVFVNNRHDMTPIYIVCNPLIGQLSTV